jgi:flagellar protein FlaG
MLIEPITISGKSIDPLAQARLPAVKGEPQRAEDSVKTKKESGLYDIAGVIADAQKNLNMIHNVNLTFTVHEASGEIMITVRDESTGELIREIPPSEVLNLAAKLDEMIGLVFDQKG